MSDNGFYFTLVRGRQSRVVHESDADALHTSIADGWDIVWDSARSPFDGHGRAASLRQAVPETWDDHWKPVPMGEPRTLYRSVSPTELASIDFYEVVTGGGNRFNEFDDRRFVFLADTLDSGLAWHGEDIERQAIEAVFRRERINDWFDELVAKRGELYDALEVAHRTAVDAWQRSVSQQGVTVHCREDEVDRMRRGIVPVSRSGLNVFGAQPRIAELIVAIQAVDVDIKMVRRRFDGMVRDEMDGIRQARADAPWTSAILEFRPMDHGLVYDNGGGGLEYGFFPGSITLDDVVSVQWVRNRELIERTGPEDISEMLEALQRRTPAPAPRMG